MLLGSSYKWSSNPQKSLSLGRENKQRAIRKIQNPSRQQNKKLINFIIITKLILISNSPNCKLLLAIKSLALITRRNRTSQDQPCKCCVIHKTIDIELKEWKKIRIFRPYKIILNNKTVWRKTIENS